MSLDNPVIPAGPTNGHALNADGADASSADGADERARPVRHGTWTGPTALDTNFPAHCYFDWHHIAGLDEEDENGHVSNVSYVRWIQDATRAHSEAVGFDRAAFETIGATFIVKRHEVDYRQGCRAGDAVIVTTTVEEIRPASAVRRTRVIRLKDGVEILKARTEWVFVAIEGHRPTRITPEILHAFALTGKVNRGRRDKEV